MASPMSMFLLQMMYEWNLVSSPRGQNDNFSLNCSDFSIFVFNFSPYRSLNLTTFFLSMTSSSKVSQTRLNALICATSSLFCNIADSSVLLRHFSGFWGYCVCNFCNIWPHKQTSQNQEFCSKVFNPLKCVCAVNHLHKFS